jgi:excisionase family DNA binding protein
VRQRLDAASTSATSPVLTVLEVAEFLKVPASTVRLKIRRGEFSYQKIGKRFLLKRSEVETHLDKGWQRQGLRVAA